MTQTGDRKALLVLPPPLERSWPNKSTPKSLMEVALNAETGAYTQQVTM